MQIQLKQPEIESALKMYLSSKGISLEGKSVAIDFTAGRKQAGLYATINIESVHIPGFSDATEDAEGRDAPALKVVQGSSDDASQATEETVSGSEPENTENQPKPTSSLFGGS